MERRAPPDHEAGPIPAFAVVLDRHFHRVIGRLRAAGHEPDLAEPFRGELLDDDPRSSTASVKACVGA